ncbi:hypothetical protein AAY81_00985 [Denitrobacterium detoxificans]|uniref:Uncharacterized protein n=2 Tax=Denitrobacterium detoxificans TaxID=79604 RepID=A0A172RW77_9ACTN|nr:hypothetical protein [Denitrobacterium detoxificans]ANE21972.1 hypothetical protein AAY81_00985 [Denitrobacterium detoxificans]SEO97719.1 hypothetical protein SAMN02910314_01793 [Denitrobacterium detoxificans]
MAMTRLNPIQQNLSYDNEWAMMVSVPAWGSFILCASQEPPSTVNMTQAQYYHPSRGWVPLTYTGSYAFRAGILLLGVNGDYIAERGGLITLANVSVSMTFD